MVIHGEKRGRGLGFPTANIALDPSNRLRHGVYAVTLEARGVVHGGVASFGRRPTFDNGPPLLEVFVFDFSGDLYGEMVEVAFHGFLRGEEKFGSMYSISCSSESWCSSWSGSGLKLAELKVTEARVTSSRRAPT